MYVCMYPCTFPLLPKKHGFSSVFAKRTSKNIEFFQIFGKRMQEAQASKKAGRGNRAWDPCFATPAPRRLRLVERHQIAARYVGDPPPPPPQKTYVIDVGRGGVRGGGYPLSSSKYPTRRAMSADFLRTLPVLLQEQWAYLGNPPNMSGARWCIPWFLGRPVPPKIRPHAKDPTEVFACRSQGQGELETSGGGANPVGSLRNKTAPSSQNPAAKSCVLFYPRNKWAVPWHFSRKTLKMHVCVRDLTQGGPLNIIDILIMALLNRGLYISPLMA